ncbi:MAG TPA: adenylosuccinate lyase [candidate division WOR-3 bacterium]|uniref:Adenylosuccinate lyase n=1 Tax=candidate division WOR-3 bacterium TaxID=2052148 RepID=A0A7V0T7A1_UNCW3|nr:adenylosuccinate lyase [candidate division WOR-3 bacterium]
MITRYTLPEMAGFWSEEGKFNSWLLVERAVARAQAEMGLIPKSAARAIARATFRISEIERFEKETNHDVIAFTRSVAKSVGPAGKYVHYGLTSYDVVDTALSLRCISALEIIESALGRLRMQCARLALEHKHTPMIGRTHGVHAEPITFGLKALSWYEETCRNLDRLRSAIAEMHHGKISGVVGSYTQLGPALEARVLRVLGLKPEPVSTQVIPRDRHAYMLAVLGLIAAGFERIAVEIRNLQRTEIAELGEPFGSRQRGSSAMPHKKNPIICERITSLSRLVRGFVATGYENIPLWHERDLSNSANERIIIPSATVIVHYMTCKLHDVLAGLVVDSDRMAANLEAAGGAFHSQGLLLALVNTGMDRDSAYRLVQRLSFAARESDVGLPALARADKEVTDRLDKRALNRVFDLKRLLRHVDTIYRRTGLRARA